MSRSVYRLFDFEDATREVARLDAQLREMLAIERPLYERHGLLAASEILDVGGGSGAPAAWLRSLGLHVVTVDSQPEAVRHAGPPRIVASAAQLPFADGSFDATFARFMLQHAPRPESVVAELARVSRDRVVITDTDLDTFLVSPDLPTGREARRRWVELARDRGADACIGRRLRSLLVGAGLSRVRVDALFVTSDDLGRETFASLLLTPHVRVVHSSDATALNRAADELAAWIEDDGSFAAAGLFVASGTHP